MLAQIVHKSDTASAFLPGRLDAFICSASFEARCLTVPRMLQKDDCVQGQTLIASNADFVPGVRGNEAILFKLFSQDALRCNLNPNDPLTTVDQLLEGLIKLMPDGSDGRVIGVDITTFTRESLLMLLNCMRRCLTANDVLIGFYNRAEDYEGEDVREQWLSRGVREIRSVVGYPGDLKPTLRRHLVVLAGLEDDRAQHLTNELEPSVLSLGTPDPETGHASEHDEKMRHRKERWLSHLGVRVNQFHFDGYSVENCVDAIRIAVGKEVSMNTILAPMNTKISTLAAGLFALRNPEVQITYAQADVYNHERYSQPASEVYVFDLSSSINALR